MTYIICTTTYLWGSNEQHVLSKHGHPAFARQIQKMSNGQCLINDEVRTVPNWCDRSGLPSTRFLGFWKPQESFSRTRPLRCWEKLSTCRQSGCVGLPRSIFPVEKPFHFQSFSKRILVIRISPFIRHSSLGIRHSWSSGRLEKKMVQGRGEWNLCFRNTSAKRNN